MKARQIAEQLSVAASSNDVPASLCELTDAWSAAGVGADSIEPILRFMEEHPDLDVGSPGPLVHFIERFLGHGYEPELLASIERRPTQHTVWMLNRLINGTAEQTERARLIEKLRHVLSNPRAAASVVTGAQSFLARLKK